MGKFNRLIPFWFFLISVSSVAGYLSEWTGVNIGNTIILYTIHILFLLLLLQNETFASGATVKNLRVVKLYLIWNIISIFRGCFVAESYWDWKVLVEHGTALMIPVAAYLSTKEHYIWQILHFFIKFGLIAFVLIVWYIPSDAYGFYLVPISLLLLFLGGLKTNLRLLLLSVACFVIFSDLGARSNVIKFLIPTLVGCLYWCKNVIGVKTYIIVHKLLFAVPLVALALGISGVFNVFDMKTYISNGMEVSRRNADGSLHVENVLHDTRTFIYKEALYSASGVGFWICGRTPARGYISEAFGEYDMNRRQERAHCEVGIINIFVWTGLIGVILYGVVLYYASILAISSSDNIYLKLIGLYIAFRWAYAWVEDYNLFTASNVYLWVAIGICLSDRLRSFDDNQMKRWINSLFSMKSNHLRSKIGNIA